MSERIGWVQITVAVAALAFITAALVAGCAAVPTGGEDDGAVSVRLTGGSIPGGDDPPDTSESVESLIPEPLLEGGDSFIDLPCGGGVEVSGAALEIDENGASGLATIALPNATVEVVVNGMTVASGAADADGEFAFEGIPSGDIVVTVTPPLGRDDLSAATAEVAAAVDGDHVSIVAVTPAVGDGATRALGDVSISPATAVVAAGGGAIDFTAASDIGIVDAVWSLKTQTDATLEAGENAAEATVVTGLETGAATVTVEADGDAATAECIIQ